MTAEGLCPACGGLLHYPPIAGCANPSHRAQQGVTSRSLGGPTAEGLTEAERNAIQDSSGAPGRLSRRHFEAVERILADRLAAVQDETVSLDFATGAMAEAGHDLEMWQHRAESAEAERDALRERVEALADEWGMDDADDFAEAIRDSGAWRFARDLRAALDADREEWKP